MYSMREISNFHGISKIWTLTKILRSLLENVKKLFLKVACYKYFYQWLLVHMSNTFRLLLRNYTTVII